MIFLILLLLVTTPQESILEQGLRYEEAGNYAEALRTWERAFLEYEKPSFVIAREYIRVATQQQLRENYETASSMYFWGLTDTTFHEKDLTTYYEELEFLEPLLPNSIARQFEELLNNENPDFFAYMGGFWQQLDPTPGTLYNERLIEHWERIAYATSTFTKNDRGIYGTDDRGEIFVRYGAPDKTFKNFVVVSIQDVHRACLLFQRCDPYIITDIVRTMDPILRYEIWIYDRPDAAMTENLIYLFAESNSSRFKRFETVEELIPPQAFTLNPKRNDNWSLKGDTDSGNISPGMIFQWVYYNEFATFDMFFGKQVTKMEKEWIQRGEFKAAWETSQLSTQGPYQGQNLASEVKMQMQMMKREAPTEHTSLLDDIPEIPLQTFPYRYLSTNGEPYYVVFLNSDVSQSMILDFIANRSAGKLTTQDSTLLLNELENYALFHGVNIQKENGELLSKSRKSVDIVLKNELELTTQNAYRIPVTSDDTETIVYAELYGSNDNDVFTQKTPFDSDLKGIGKSVAELPAPLEWKESELILGDIILGYDMNYDLEERAYIPFTPSHYRTIPMNEVLAMHFEVYNLATDDNGEGNFQFNYQITKPRSFQWIRGRAKEVGLSATFTTIGGMFSEDIEIQTRDLQEGKYTLEIEIKDLNSDRIITRDLDFEVVSALPGKN